MSNDHNQPNDPNTTVNIDELGLPSEESASPVAGMTVEQLEEVCRKHYCPTCPEKAQLDDQRLRNLAELENIKKRLQREKDEQVKYAAESVLADLLPTLDNLDLALQYGHGDETCRNVIIGVEMTRKLLLDAVARHGLVPVGASGEAFTPEWHEAMGYEDREDMPADHVASLMQKGYRLKDRLLRPAKVTVSRKPS